jgi:hypothetical protein
VGIVAAGLGHRGLGRVRLHGPAVEGERVDGPDFGPTPPSLAQNRDAT